MPSHRELKERLVRLSSDQDMQGHHFFHDFHGRFFLYCWASKEAGILEITRLWREARWLCAYEFAVSAIEERSVTELEVECPDSFRVCPKGRSLQPRTSHKLALEIFGGQMASEPHELEISRTSKECGMVRFRCMASRVGERQKISGALDLASD